MNFRNSEIVISHDSLNVVDIIFNQHHRDFPTISVNQSARRFKLCTREWFIIGNE